MAADGSRILIRGVRPMVVAKYLAQLWLPLAGALAVPLAVALALGETAFAWRVAAILAAVAVVAPPVARRPAPAELSWNEALAVIALIFMTSSLVLAWPFTGFGLPLVDALFEAVSAITTTGLTTVADVTAHGPAYLFTRAWIQWYAGYLIVVVGLALVFPPGAAAKRFAQSGVGESDVIGGTRGQARRTAVAYVLLTVAALVAVIAAGAAPLDALLHVFTAVSTAGFSSHNDSIAALAWPAQAVLMLSALLGAISFSIYHRAAILSWRRVWRDPELLALLLACLVSSLAITAILGLSGHVSWGEAVARAPLLAISAQTTTGFEPLSPSGLDDGSKLVLTASMLIGGDVGSTAGGIKIIRLLVVVGLIRMLLLRTALPRHAIADLRVAGRRFTTDELQRMLATTLLFLLALAASWLAFVLAGAPAVDALFEVTSALATTGLSAGLAAPELATGLKLLLCLDMLAGRVEILALLILVYPPTWFGRHA